MLDKFIGDGIMAAFGIPVAHGDDEDCAVRAAIDMTKALFAWNVERLAQGKKPVYMRIGLNTDEVVSGNIGSPKRMDYTLIGDGVNVATRLESACKEYSAQILMDENTYRKLRGTYRIREVDSIVVKGKTEPVVVYEVLDYHTNETSSTCPSDSRHHAHTDEADTHDPEDRALQLIVCRQRTSPLHCTTLLLDVYG